MEPFVATMASSAISAVIAAIVAALVTKIKTVKAKADETKAEEAKTQGMLKDMMKMVCRMTIYSDKFSVDEKLEAYVIYRDSCHENHQTKTYMDGLVGGDVDEYLEKHGIGGTE